MSVLVERSMGDLNKEGISVYPLFQKGSTAQQSQPKKRTTQDDSKMSDEPPISADVPKDGPKRRVKKSKIQDGQTSGLKASGIGNSKAAEHGELLDVDPNNGRRKRRKTTPFEEGKSTKDMEAVPQVVNDTPPLDGSLGNFRSIAKAPSAIVADNASEIADEGTSATSYPPIKPLPVHDEAGNNKEMATKSDDIKPPKVLRFNPRTGTIGSPPTKKPQLIAPSNGKKTTSGRAKAPKSKVVTIRYGPGQLLPLSVGQKIDQIFNNVKPVALVKKLDSPIIVVPRSPKQRAKSTHPFFLGKAATKPESLPKPDKKDADVIDLTKPKENSAQPRVRPSSTARPSSPSKAPASFSGFSSSAKITKFPGALEPAWPWKDIVHVRGSNSEFKCSEDLPSNTTKLMSHGKKSKYQAICILEEEDILGCLAKDLCISNILDSIREINPYEFPPVPDCLRLPIKHLESGFDIQKKIRKELRTRMPTPKAIVESPSQDESEAISDGLPPIHPALLKTFGLISTSLSAFDKGQCETQSWSQKYSPKLACDVLQTGRDVTILKTWLQSLTVKAVEAGLGNANGANSSKRSGAKPEPGAKRKRKSKKLDGFVVSSDEDADEMDEISGDEGFSYGNQSQRRTVVRTGDLARESGRSTNAVVISGPHGCGKTAAVYAVAKELGFEVFEINPGSRRTGKDIWDRVGDMAHNHQVQRSSGPAQTDVAADDDRNRIDEALADDLKSGRQGTMNSFFKTQPVAKPKSKTQPNATTPASKASTQQIQAKLDTGKAKTAAKAQKQSLILIEEADILYKEDTQFWSTILELITKSRRAIVLTCNDESALPMTTLPLHAVIRMNPPPVDLAVDYMLLVAACEGHVIEREAVQTLYECRNMDLRASMLDLDFWCQFAIGDQKNGLSWYFSRWPKGSDIDENGNFLRVVSEGTYKSGMGFLSQDVLESPLHHLDIEEETLHEACDDWNLDAGNWQESLNMASWAQNIQEQSRDKAQNRASLDAYEEFVEALSSADLCSDALFASDTQLPIDPTIPGITTKARDDYILASKVLDAPTVVNYDTLSRDISLWIKSRSRSYLQVTQHVNSGYEVPMELGRPDETTIIQLIRKESTSPGQSLTRRDFSAAFDPIAEPEKTPLYTTGQLEASVVDRTMNIIVEDMAPYVRSIVEFDTRLQAERAKLSNLMSEGGGRKGKRMRTTRAAMSALEGGVRSTTRREKYFGSSLNPYFVMSTGMQSWTDAALAVMSTIGSRRSSKGSIEEAKTDSDKDELSTGQ